MTSSTLTDAFGHHVWATLRILDTCAELTPEQLETAVPGTYGSILETLRHLVASDAYYVSVLSGGPISDLEEAGLDIPQLRTLMAENGEGWSALLASEPDEDRDVTRHRDDGSESHAPVSIRLAQMLHHGTDHRSQICTALTALGMEPPAIDVWEYGALDGRVHQTDPTA